MTNIKNIFYEDKETQDIMRKYYQKKKSNNLTNFVISVRLNYVDKTDFLILSRKSFLSPNSKLEIMHVLKKCYIENATVGVHYRKILH